MLKVRAVLGKVIGISRARSYRTSLIAAIIFDAVESPAASIPLPVGWVSFDRCRFRLPATYGIYRDGVLCYIGSASDPVNRLGSHEIFNKIGRVGITIKVRYAPKHDGLHLAREYRLIKRLRPAYNVTHRGEVA